MRVAVFITCLADVLYPRVGRATVSVLERLGHAVTFPAGQTCCGQMHTNTGYQDDAGVLIRHHVDVRLVRRFGSTPARAGGPRTR
jgi:L-lactate dehydrogenase complex protein LldE